MPDNHKAKIMIISNDWDIIELTKLYLKAKRYSIITEFGGSNALQKIKSEPPSLILLDSVLSDISGTEIIDTLKKDPTFWHIPIISLTNMGNHDDKIIGVQSGADDYIVKPFEPEELLARIKMILMRTSYILDANPLTKLPGNSLINAKILQLLEQPEKFAIGYLDIDHFKSFNDEYGFGKGDQIIENTASILIKTLKQHGNLSDFVGHIGGDDFVFITHPEKVDVICRKIISTFIEKSADYYPNKAKKHGYISTKDRQGKKRQSPLMSVSIAVVTNENRIISHIAEITAIATELKKHAKSHPGNVYIKDRRLNS